MECDYSSLSSRWYISASLGCAAAIRGILPYCGARRAPALEQCPLAAGDPHRKLCPHPHCHLAVALHGLDALGQTRSQYCLNPHHPSGHLRHSAFPASCSHNTTDDCTCARLEWLTAVAARTPPVRWWPLPLTARTSTLSPFGKQRTWKHPQQ